MKTVFVTGISGFLGSQMASFAPTDVKIVGCSHTQAITLPKVESFPLDLTNAHLVTKKLDEIQPDAIIHLAALSNPNYCEQHPAQSQAVNVDTSMALAKWAAGAEVPFLFSSTDLVFDGQDAPYSEADAPNPVSVYGQHKVQAEQAILSVYPKAIVARLPLLFGLALKNQGFMTNWLEKLRAGETVFAFSDEFRTPASTASVAKGIWLLLEKSVSGIWHLGGAERISRYDFAVQMAEVFGLPTKNIQASLQKDVNMPATRPADVSLDSLKAFELGYQPKSVREELEMMRS